MRKPLSDQDKKRVRIEALLQLGFSESIIANKVACSLSTVKRWKKRFTEGASEQDRPRAGRPLQQLRHDANFG
jgi:transposase